MQLIPPGSPGINASDAPVPQAEPDKSISRRKAAFLSAQEAAQERRDKEGLGFQLDKGLPPGGWWRFQFDLSAPATLFIVGFQFWFQRGHVMRNHKRWAVETQATWQQRFGVTPDEWPKLWKKHLARLVEHQVHIFGEGRRTFLRPTQEFLDVFGVDRADYDIVGRVEERASKRGRPKAGQPAPTKVPLSPEEQEAVFRWTGKGGHIGRNI